MDQVVDQPGNTAGGRNLVQSFGFAALLILIGVLSSWVYLKRAGEVASLTTAPIETLLLQPLTPGQQKASAEPDEVATWVQFGEEAYAAGRIIEPAADNALYYYSKALEQAPVHLEALAGMDRVVRHLVSGSESAIFQGDWQEARRFAEQLRTLRPEDTRALALLERINRLEQLENLMARADRQVAASRLTEPRDDNALETYRRILTIDPGNGIASQGIESIAQRLLGVAQSAALAGESDRANRYIARVKSINANAPGLADAEAVVAQWSEMVSNQHLQEQLEAASAALEAGRLTAPAEPNALALFDKVLELDPSSDAARQGKRLVVQALIERAWSEIRAGRFSTAEQTLESASSAGAESFALVELEDEIDYQRALTDARRGVFGRTFTIAELNVRRREIPEYPRSTRGDGWVDVQFTVAESGEVVDALVSDSSSPDFEDAALGAIGRWLFRPYLYKDRPLPVRVAIRFAFKE
jgi:TonB family protein